MDDRRHLVGILKFLLRRTPHPNDALIAECLKILRAPEAGHDPVDLCRGCLTKLAVSVEPKPRARASMQLSPLHVDLLQALEAGEDLVSYARRTGAAESTVKSRARALFKLTGAHTSAQALAKAIRAGVI